MALLLKPKAFPIFILALAGCDPRASEELQVSEDSQNCENVDPGMTIDEVIEIMGEPKYRTELHPESNALKFSYSSPPFASGPISITFRRAETQPYLVDYKFCDGEP